MPIASITSNSLSLPSTIKESRLRATPLEIEDREARGEQSAVYNEYIARNDQQSVPPVVEVEPQYFQRIPSFDDLPTPQRVALETYLQTEQAIPRSTVNDNASVVGVDTFV